jgi:hypothetical protein
VFARSSSDENKLLVLERCGEQTYVSVHYHLCNMNNRTISRSGILPSQNILGEVITNDSYFCSLQLISNNHINDGNRSLK